MTPGPYRAGLCAALILVVLAAAAAPAEDAATEIRATLERWTEDFNAGRKDKVCDLFTKDARADVADAPERDHAAICEVLTRALNDQTRKFSYALDIKEILVFTDVAVVRLVWTSTLTQKDGSSTVLIEPGMDIFQKQPDGSWKIIRYLAYER